MQGMGLKFLSSAGKSSSSDEKEKELKSALHGVFRPKWSPASTTFDTTCSTFIKVFRGSKLGEIFYRKDARAVTVIYVQIFVIISIRSNYRIIDEGDVFGIVFKSSKSSGIHQIDEVDWGKSVYNVHRDGWRVWQLRRNG